MFRARMSLNKILVVSIHLQVNPLLQLLPFQHHFRPHSLLYHLPLPLVLLFLRRNRLFQPPPRFLLRTDPLPRHPSP